MIIQCKSCTRKFIVKDENIPEEGRNVQCGYCSVTWHQMPTNVAPKPIKKTSKKIGENLSVDAIKASDGKTYKFLGSQWAQVFPSGKTGLFAKKKIGNQLDKLTGRQKEIITNKQKKKTKKELDPSSGNLDNNKQLPDIYKPNQGLGFFGYVFLLIIISFSIVGMLKTFENDLLNAFPDIDYLYQLLDQQLQFLAETFKNMIVIVNDLLSSY